VKMDNKKGAVEFTAPRTAVGGERWATDDADDASPPLSPSPSFLSSSPLWSQQRSGGMTPLIIPGEESSDANVIQRPQEQQQQQESRKSSLSPEKKFSRHGKRITSTLRDPNNPYYRSPYDHDSRQGAFWSVVTSIIGIQRQADGAGGRERDTSLDHKEITAYDFEFLRVRGVLSPQDPYHTSWEIFSGLFVVYTSIEVPFRIGFMFFSAPSVGELVIEYFIVVVFFVDMVINFLTAHTCETTNILVYDHNKIAIRYVSKAPFWFWMDLISTFPFEALAVGAGSKSKDELAALKVFRLLRLFRITKLFRLLNSEGLQR